MTNHSGCLLVPGEGPRTWGGRILPGSLKGVGDPIYGPAITVGEVGDVWKQLGTLWGPGAFSRASWPGPMEALTQSPELEAGGGPAVLSQPGGCLVTR